MKKDYYFPVCANEFAMVVVDLGVKKNGGYL